MYNAMTCKVTRGYNTVFVFPDNSEALCMPQKAPTTLRRAAIFLRKSHRKLDSQFEDVNF